jgi:apolipoprotein N-acyltransferase
MHFPRHTRALLALASGAALALSFPNYNLWPLAWFSIGLLVLACSGTRLPDAVLYGVLHGLAFFPVSIPWIYTVMHQYGNINPWGSAGILGLMGLADGVICCLFTAGIAIASRRGWVFVCVLAPFLWVTREFARETVPYIGFPWNSAGYAAARSIVLAQLTTITGIYGLSFLVAAFGSLFVCAVLTGRERVWKITIAAAGALVFIAAIGRFLIPLPAPRYVAHLVQTNFPQSEQYPPDWLQIHAGELDELEHISISAAKREPGLIIWPEVPAPFSSQDPVFRERIERIARDSGSDFLVGVVDWKQDAKGQWIAGNSAVLLNPSGQRIYSYDKIHLVPFGEYVPLRQWLTFAGRLTADISDFTPGTSYDVGQIPGGRFGTFICYESIFADEIRRFAANGAELLINISNDGWFGRSSAPLQHLTMARVRAIESRRWLLRATNNGFTAAIDPYGRIVKELPTDIRGQLDAPYDFRYDVTLYVRYGNWFPWLCVLVSIAMVGLALVSPNVRAKCGAGEPQAVTRT